MNEQLKATSTADILSFIPHALGRTPRNSFVLLTMQGKRLGATLRIDAPTTGEPADYARRVVTYLAADEKATGVLLAVYMDADEHPNPHIGHLEAISRELTLAAMPLKDAWLVTPTHWRGLLADTGNQPVEAITDSRLNAELIYAGSNHHEDTANYGPFTGGAGTETLIQGAIPSASLEDITAARKFWTRTLATGPQEPDVDTAVQLIAALHNPIIRDLMMCDVVTNGLPADFRDIGSIVLGTGITPDWARVDTAQHAARALIAAAPEGFRAPMLCLIGWLEYLKGRASVAVEHFDLAEADTPGYRLAQLLTEVVSRGNIAGTAQNPGTAYRRLR
jgi:hypothetical protein